MKSFQDYVRIFQLYIAPSIIVDQRIFFSHFRNRMGKVGKGLFLSLVNKGLGEITGQEGGRAMGKLFRLCLNKLCFYSLPVQKGQGWPTLATPCQHPNVLRQGEVVKVRTLNVMLSGVIEAS